jgi:glycerol-3-phosphate O-acyltransferase/dihydroxyacetone phosphate acyltransferase
MAAILPYTINKPPPLNPFLKLAPEVEATLNRSTSSPTVPTLATTQEDKHEKLKDRRLRRPPSRRLVRHVLRVRAEAMRLLAAYLISLDREGVKVPASLHMVKVFGGGIQTPSPSESTSAISEASYDKVDGGGQGEAKSVHGGVEIGPSQEGGGWRDGREVVRYLGSRDGNKVKELFTRYASGLDTARGNGAESEGEWAALSSEGEDDATNPRPEEEMTWVPPTGRF